MHYPAHESLQEFAKRYGFGPLNIPATIYEKWSNRSYPEVRVRRKVEVFDHITEQSVGFVTKDVFHAARGPGLRCFSPPR